METRYDKNSRWLEECKCDDGCPVAHLSHQLRHSESTSYGRRDSLTNHKIMIDERMHAILQLFLSWDELNRVRFLDMLLDRSHPNLIRYLKYETTRRLKNSIMAPDSKQDFTRILPRTVCIRIFSYLDVRSLGRCAQVCGYWKYLSESNEIWEQKCRIHRIPVPTEFHNGIHAHAIGTWKNLYIQHANRHGQRRRSQSSNGSDRSRSNGQSLQSHQRPTKIPIPRHGQPQTMVIEEKRVDQSIFIDHMSKHNGRHHHHSTGAINQLLDAHNRNPAIDDRRTTGQHKHAPTPPVRRKIRQSASADQSKRPVAPWRPSAPHPEDTHYDKIGKRFARAPQPNRRPSSSGPKPRSSSNHNLNGTRDRPHSGITHSNKSAMQQAARSNDHNHMRLNLYDHDDDHDQSPDMAISKSYGHEERNIQISYDDGPLHWRYTNGGAVGYESDDEQDFQN